MEFHTHIVAHRIGRHAKQYRARSVYYLAVAKTPHLPNQWLWPRWLRRGVRDRGYRPNKRALKAFLQAKKLSDSNENERAAAALERAVGIDPQFVEAHGSLGVQYALLKQFERAADEFRRAIALDPSTAQNQSNLALVLIDLGQSDEAEHWARHAVQLDSADAKAHYALGCVLLWQSETRAAGIQELQLAARGFPKAHWTLAELYRIAGAKDLAREEMRRYLAADPSANKAAVELWSLSLR